MTDAISVSAEVVQDDSIVRVDFSPAEIRVDYAAVLDKVQALISPYKGLTEEQWLAVDMKECKASRAHLNKIKKEVNASRKLIEQNYTKPLNEFKEFCKNLGAMVDECSASVDAAIKLREQRERQAKRDTLNDHFYEFCSDNGFRALTESVEFDQILNPQMLNKTYSVDKARREIEQRVAEIMHSLQTLSEQQLFDRDGAMIEFFKSLSLTKALEHDARRKAEQAKLDAMREEQQEVQSFRQEEQTSIEAYMPDEPVAMEQEPVYDWLVYVSCTRTQLYQLRDVMVSMGLDPHAKREVRNG